MSLTTLKKEKSFSLNRSLLHDYQEKAVSFIKENDSCALFVKMGLGKTVSTLTALQDMADGLVIRRTLIVAPLRVAKSTWPAEIKAWDHINLSYTVLCGSQAQRLKRVTEDTEVHLINRENVPWLVDYFGQNWPYDCVVIDESTSFKSSKSKRFKALKKVRGKINKVVLLTGTPAPNSLLDLWSQIFLIDQGVRLGKTFSGFRSRFFESDYMGYNWTLREGASQKIYETIEDICLTLDDKDYLELPDRVDNQVVCELSVAERKTYEEFKNQFLIELDGVEIDALNAAALTNKLLQMANGAIYTEGREFIEIHQHKLDALAEIIEANPGEPVLVAYNFKSDLERLQRAFKHAVVLDKDPATIDRWNAGEIPLLLAHPASAGHGLNLQKGGNVCVWFGLNWSLELYQQFNARLHRQGQTEPVIVHHITMKNTVDELVVAALLNKADAQQALIDYLKTQTMQLKAA